MNELQKKLARRKFLNGEGEHVANAFANEASDERDIQNAVSETPSLNKNPIRRDSGGEVPMTELQKKLLRRRDLNGEGSGEQITIDVDVKSDDIQSSERSSLTSSNVLVEEIPESEKNVVGTVTEDEKDGCIEDEKDIMMINEPEADLVLLTDPVRLESKQTPIDMKEEARENIERTAVKHVLTEVIQLEELVGLKENEEELKDKLQAEREATELETRLQAETEAAELETRLQAKREAAELEARLQAEREAAELEARLQAEREGAELEARLQAEREAAELEARLQAETEAAEQDAKMKLEREAAELEARLQAEKEAAELEARLQAETEAAELESRLQAEREAAEQDAKMKLEREAAELEARLQAERERAELEARLQAERERAELEARLQAEREAAELEARLQAEREAAELEARLQAEREAAELDVKMKLEKEATELKAKLYSEDNGKASTNNLIHSEILSSQPPSISQSTQLDRQSDFDLDEIDRFLGAADPIPRPKSYLQRLKNPPDIFASHGFDISSSLTENDFRLSHMTSNQVDDRDNDKASDFLGDLKSGGPNSGIGRFDPKKIQFSLDDFEPQKQQFTNGQAADDGQTDACSAEDADLSMLLIERNSPRSSRVQPSGLDFKSSSTRLNNSLSIYLIIHSFMYRKKKQCV